MQSVGIWPTESPIRKENDLRLNGLIFVITGTLPTLSREDAKSRIERAGGKTTDSVSRNTNYLVLGENAGSKLTKATELGIPILSEEELLKMLSE